MMLFFALAFLLPGHRETFPPTRPLPPSYHHRLMMYSLYHRFAVLRKLDREKEDPNRSSSPFVKVSRLGP